MSLGKFLGEQDVEIASLLRTGDREEERAYNAVHGIDASVKHVGMIHLPVVRIGEEFDTWDVIVGNHRVTAAEDAGQKTIRVRLWSGTDAEAEALKREENIRRAHLHGADLKAAIEQGVAALKALGTSGTMSRFSRTASEEEREDSELDATRVRDRVKVRKAIAKREGVTPAAIKKREQRAHSKPPVEREPEPEPVELPYSFKGAGDYFPAIAEARKADILDAYGEMTEWKADGGLLQDRIARTKARLAKVVPAVYLDGIDRAAQALILAITNARPHALCIPCRGEGCQACHKTGIVGERLFNDQVAINPTAAINASPRARKAVQVEMPDGSMFTPEEEKAS